MTTPSPARQVLVVEDDRRIATLLRDYVIDFE
jgi:hypothetical protein